MATAVQGNATDRMFTAPQPSFVFDDAILNPHAVAAPQQGSTAGVPPSAAIAGNTDGNFNSSLDNAAKAATSGPAHNNPIFWLIVLMALGVLLLGVVAHLETRRR